MKTISATYKVTTPMFLGGADHQPDGIRLSAFKGALRFWWRALNWRRVYQEANGSQKAALKQLHKEECDLFGAAYMDGKGGQGAMLMRIKQNQDDCQTDDEILGGIGYKYLLGQGLANKRNPRTYIKPGYEFTIIIKLKSLSKGYQEKITSQIKRALQAIGLLGGLGCRARRGFGSLKILKLIDDGKETKPSSNEDTYVSYQLPALFQSKKYPLADIPPFTAFSDFAMAQICFTESNWLNALDKAGQKLQIYRSNGQKGMINHEKEALQIFEDDHDEILNFLRGKKVFKQPKRVIFGIPHNYFYSSIKNGYCKADIDLVKHGTQENYRKASPLFIHIHEICKSKFAVLKFVIPAEFFPPDARVSYTKQENKREQLAPKTIFKNPSSVDWSDIYNYLELDQFKGKKGSFEKGFVKRKIVFRGEKC